MIFRRSVYPVNRTLLTVDRFTMYTDCAFRVMNLGIIDYVEALGLQKSIVADIAAGRTPHTVITCQHLPVITLPPRAKNENILVSREELKRLGIRVFPTDRGGEVTYHGPGQLLFYSLFDLRQDEKDLHLYLRKLEQVAISALRDNFGLNAYRKEDLTGVWIGPYKVASIGIRVKNWVAYHGFSLNVEVEKKYFSTIRPCGMDIPMASINDFFSDAVSLETVRDMLISSFADVFQMRPKLTEHSERKFFIGRFDP